MFLILYMAWQDELNVRKKRNAFLYSTVGLKY